MNKVLFLVLTLCVTTTLAQTKPQTQPQSKIDEFTARSGVLLERSFEDVGKIAGTSIQVMQVRDVVTGTKVSGVRFEKTVASKYTTDQKVAVLDADELDGLLKSMVFLKSNIAERKPETYTEITFTSRSGFSAGAFFSDGMWKQFIKIEKFDAQSYVYFVPEEFDKFIELLTTSKTKLK